MAGFTVRPRMHADLATVRCDPGAEVVRVGGVADHVHIATTLPRTVSQAELIERIKENVLESHCRCPPPRAVCGERIEVRGRSKSGLRKAG